MLTRDQRLGVILLHDLGYKKRDLQDIFGMTHGQLSYLFEKVDLNRRSGRDDWPEKCDFPGGLVTACETPTDYQRYLAEVRAYLAAHPKARVFDVAMECHMAREQARTLMRRARA
jgi:hypothetical protein